MKELIKFIKESPTQFHACENVSKYLDNLGFIKLNEADVFNLKMEGKYYITRNGSSILAFTIPSDTSELSYNITAAHLDSPRLKIKPNFKIDAGKYLKLNTEVYGGPIFNTWMDRPLNICGRLVVRTDKGIESKVFSFDKAMAIIPNCSIHYNREVNKGVPINPQVELLPIYSDNKDTDLLELAAKKANVNKDDILSYDLYTAVMESGTLVGANDEFIVCPQLDDLECAYGLLKGFEAAGINNKSVNILALFDNEEIGSDTRQGAASMMLSDTLKRISLALGKSEEEHYCALASSFIVSADNAQGFHPNFPGKFDPTNACYLNGGIVVKSAARGSYTTDALSLAYFKEVCNKANAKVQMTTNRSDIPGGGTLGAISLTHVSIPSVDIGLAQVAMHSAVETAGALDYNELIKAITEFYKKHIKLTKDNTLAF